LLLLATTGSLISGYASKTSPHLARKFIGKNLSSARTLILGSRRGIEPEEPPAPGLGPRVAGAFIEARGSHALVRRGPATARHPSAGDGRGLRFCPRWGGLRVYLDNGAFSCLLRGTEPDVEEFREFVRATTPAWYPVPADFIPRPSDSKRRQRTLFERTIAVLEAHADGGFCPVVHAGPWLDHYLEAIRRLGRTTHLAIGGLVPHLLNSPGAARRETIARMKRVRKEFPGTIHAFGLGGIVTLHMAAALEVERRPQTEKER
jgi:hypothetical protein